MDDDMKFLLLEIPLAFSRPTEEILERAAEIGRKSGRDDDWVPLNLEDAAYEILISAGGYHEVMEAGVIPRPELEGEDFASRLFTLVIEVRATEDDSLFYRTDHLRPEDWPSTILSACLSVLMSEYPPLDFDVEIIRPHTDPPASNHAAMEREKRIRTSITTGHAMLRHAHREKISFTVPVSLSRSGEEIIAGSKDLWGPYFDEESLPLDEIKVVLHEIILGSTGMEDLARRGVRLHPELSGTTEGAAMLALTFEVLTNPSAAFIAGTARLRPEDWPATIEASCLAVMASGEDPEDHTMAIYPPRGEAVSSNHARLELVRRIEASRRYYSG